MGAVRTHQTRMRALRRTGVDCRSCDGVAKTGDWGGRRRRGGRNVGVMTRRWRMYCGRRRTTAGWATTSKLGRRRRQTSLLGFVGEAGFALAGGSGERGDAFGLSSRETRIRRGAPNYSMRVPDQRRNDSMPFCLWTVFSRMMRFAVAYKLLRDMQITVFSIFFAHFWLPPYVYPFFYP